MGFTQSGKGIDVFLCWRMPASKFLLESTPRFKTRQQGTCCFQTPDCLRNDFGVVCKEVKIMVYGFSIYGLGHHLLLSGRVHRCLTYPSVSSAYTACHVLVDKFSRVPSMFLFSVSTNLYSQSSLSRDVDSLLSESCFLPASLSVLTTSSW